ncbi:MAG: hypothetical protein V4685_15590 [Bacteroidota bacterium]
MERLALIAISLLFNSYIFGQVDNNGHKIIQKSLNVIEEYLKNPNSSTSTDRGSVVHFFTELTGIVSQSDGNYFGQTSPTKEDFINWSRWFLLNKESIFWDEEKKKIVLTKYVIPPTTDNTQ